MITKGMARDLHWTVEEEKAFELYVMKYSLQAMQVTTFQTVKKGIERRRSMYQTCICCVASMDWSGRDESVFLMLLSPLNEAC